MTAVKRMLQYLDKKGISKYKFYKTTGLSNGFLDKGDNIGSDKCEIILSHYPDLRVEWLITGKGEMLKRPDETRRPYYDPAAYSAVVEEQFRGYDQRSMNFIEPDSPQAALLQQQVRHLSNVIYYLEAGMDSKERSIESLEKIITTQEKLIQKLEKLIDPKSGGKTVTDASRSIRSTQRQLDPKGEGHTHK